MTKTSFNPNSMTFAEGVKRLRKAVTAASVPTGKILTSRDRAVATAVRKLLIKNIPDGFTKWQLPVYLGSASQFFFSYGNPGTEVPPHSHDEGDGLRVILHGSIHFGDVELTAGDWMFIPKGTRYSFKVGPQGVGMFYCYECCCA